MAAAQPPASLQFDVASIKVAVPLETQITTGQLRVSQLITDTRVDLKPVSLADLVALAYGIKDYQLTGPDWLRTERYEVAATLPAGSTKEQVPAMLQTLLADRFKLKFHREKKSHGVYALVVSSDGHKLQAAAPDPAPDAPPPPGSRTVDFGGQEVRITDDGRGGGSVTTSQGTTRVSTNGSAMRLELAKVTMAQYAEMLGQFVDKPVIDQTALPGNYQISLELSQEEMIAMAMARAAAAGISLQALGANIPGAAPGQASAPSSSASIFATVQKQGLRLEPRNLPLDDIVVDSATKVPTEN